MRSAYARSTKKPSRTVAANWRGRARQRVPPRPRRTRPRTMPAHGGSTRGTERCGGRRRRIPWCGGASAGDWRSGLPSGGGSGESEGGRLRAGSENRQDPAPCRACPQHVVGVRVPSGARRSPRQADRTSEEKRRERPCKPDSVSPVRGGGHFSGTDLAAGLERPTRKGIGAGRRHRPSLFGLSPGGVCPARPVTRPAVRSYRTVSPLPPPRRRAGGLFSVALSLASRPVAVNNHPDPWSPDFPPRGPDGSTGRSGRPDLSRRAQCSPRAPDVTPPALDASLGRAP